MSEKPITPLRQRMIEDMTVRNFVEKTRNDYIRQVKTFTSFLGRSPDTATAEDLRRFQLHQTQTGVRPPSINSTVVNRRAKGTPDRHEKGTPHRRWDRLVPVANRRVPRASRSALTSDAAARAGGACLPTGASRGGTQARCLKRQLSLPVSMISQ